MREAVATPVGFTTTRAAHVRPAFPWAIELGLLAFFVAELVGLSMAFDTWRLDAVPSVWAQIVAWSPHIARLVLAVTVAALALDGRRVLTALGQATRTAARPRAVAFAMHLIAIAIFAWVTSSIVNGDVMVLPYRPAWTIAWAASGAVALAAWAVAVFPGRVWLTSIRPRGTQLVLGVLAGTSVWAFGYVTQEIWEPMARVTFGVVVWALSFIYNETTVDPALLRVGTPGFQVRINAACSGYEGIGLIVSFLSIYLWMFRRELRFPAALLLLPIGAVTIWLVNLVRIVALVAIGSAGWPAIALGGFHSQAGWIAFLTIALGFVALTSHSNVFKTTVASAEAPSREADSTIALLAPFAAITATAMLTGAFSAGFDWLYPLRVVAAGAVLWRFRSEYLKLVTSWSWSWWPVTVGLATAAIWVAFMPSAAQVTNGWPSMLSGISLGSAALWAAFRTIGYVVMAPLAEELAFRAFLTRRFQRVDIDRVPMGHFTWFSFLASSVLFGALHGQLWVIGTLAGMAFALALYRRGAFADAVVAHAVTNGALAAYAVLTGQWSAWS